MRLLSDCHVFVYEVRMMWWWCCLVNVMCLSMKWGWCDDVVMWVSCVCVWSEVDVMILLNECLVFVYEVRMMWWSCCLSVISLCMKLEWCDEVVDWVSCVCVWNEDDVMILLTECHVFVYEVRMIWWSCWVSVVCLCIKCGWSDDDVVKCHFFVYEVVEWVSCVCV